MLSAQVQYAFGRTAPRVIPTGPKTGRRPCRYFAGNAHRRATARVRHETTVHRVRSLLKIPMRCVLDALPELPGMNCPPSSSAWILPLRAEALQDEDAAGLRLVAPSNFHRQWLRDRYLRRIELGEEYFGGVPAIEVGLAPAGGLRCCR